MKVDDFTRKIEILKNRVEELKRRAGEPSAEPEGSLAKAVEELYAALKGLPARQELEESQRAFSTLISNLPGMAYRCHYDRDWTMEFVSEGCFDLTGYYPSDLIENRKLAYAQLIHRDDREPVWKDVQIALRENRPFQIVYRIITAAGKEKWVWEQGRGVFSSDRNLLALEGFITDITEHKRAEEALRRSETWLSSLVDTTQDAVVSIDRQGRIVLFNTAAEKIFGYTKAEVQGRKVNMLMAEPHVSEHDSYIARYEQTGEAHAIGRIRTLEARRKNGDIFPIEVSITEVKTAGEVRYAAFIRDISEKTRLQEQLIESERLAAIGATAAKFAHEIGNPLNGMFMTAQLLDRRLARQIETLDDTVKSTVQKLKDEITRLSNLLHEFSSLSRREKYNFRPVSLATLCGEIYALERQSLDARRIHVEQDFPEDLPMVNADSDKFKQVLLNLCKNASEAMPQGGTITLRAYNSREQVVLEIIDNGIGIPPGVDVFEPFSTTKTSGSGLGLMVVRQIISAHRGTITYKSDAGRGTVFRLTVPKYPGPAETV